MPMSTTHSEWVEHPTGEILRLKGNERGRCNNILREPPRLEWVERTALDPIAIDEALAVLIMIEW